MSKKEKSKKIDSDDFQKRVAQVSAEIAAIDDDDSISPFKKAVMIQNKEAKLKAIKEEYRQYKETKEDEKKDLLPKEVILTFVIPTPEDYARIAAVKAALEKDLAEENDIASA